MPSRSSSSMMAPPLLQGHHELQGPRPAPLKVSTTTTGTADMNKRRRRLHQQAPPPRQPVIIYVESPRVVHAHPGEFKSVVQRLTGAPAPAAAPSPPPTMVFSASAPPPPPPPLQLELQFPFQFQFQFPLVEGAAGSAGALLPLTTSCIVSATTDASGSSSAVQENENLCSVPFLPPPSCVAACYQYQYHGGA